MCVSLYITHVVLFAGSHWGPRLIPKLMETQPCVCVCVCVCVCMCACVCVCACACVCVINNTWRLAYYFSVLSGSLWLIWTAALSPWRAIDCINGFKEGKQESDRKTNVCYISGMQFFFSDLNCVCVCNEAQTVFIKKINYSVSSIKRRQLELITLTRCYSALFFWEPFAMAFMHILF